MDDPMHQHLLAETGDAQNQCPSCGVCRTDGKPSVVHRSTCTNPEARHFELRGTQPPEVVAPWTI